MASGYGFKGGRGRCFPFWQEFAKCYGSADNVDQCELQYEDYQECLFHKKEYARLKMVLDEYYKQRKDKGIPENKPMLQVTINRLQQIEKEQQASLKEGSA